MRLQLLALALVAPACYSKSDLLLPPGCTGDACTTGEGPAEESSSGGDDSDDESDPSSSPSTDPDPTTDPSTDPTTDPTTDSTDADTSSTEPADSSDDESSTGEPADNMYAPCTSDDMCTSGFCVEGFCSQVCWSQVEGETPCPPAPDGAEGVNIVCGVVPHHNGFDHFCEGCLDCAQYCIAECDVDSTCPNGGYPVHTGCIGTPLHCGMQTFEGSDETCDDGFDNDADTYFDCDDLDCTGEPSVTVCGPGENTDATCSDGIDNDDDGFLDCVDFDCSNNIGVTVCG